jgi:hypothetical protein
MKEATQPEPQAVSAGNHRVPAACHALAITVTSNTCAVYIHCKHTLGVQQQWLLVQQQWLLVQQQRQLCGM